MSPSKHLSVCFLISASLLVPVAGQVTVKVESTDGRILGGATVCIGSENAPLQYGPLITANLGEPGEGSVTFDEVEVGDYLVTATHRDHLGAQVSLTVADDPESTTVRLESGNPGLGPTCFWRPMISVPAFFPVELEETERRNYNVSAGEAALFGLSRLWTFDSATEAWFLGLGRRCDLDLGWQGPGPDAISLVAHSSHKSLRCTFTLFGRRELNEGWLFQSYSINSDECEGTFVIDEEPEPGSSSPQLTITVTDSGLFEVLAESTSKRSH